MPPRTWFPELLTGSRIVLRRHAPENVSWFRKWYADPEIARLARYQEAPMRADEIERFFAARVVGPDALAMAIRLAETLLSDERNTDDGLGDNLIANAL